MSRKGICASLLRSYCSVCVIAISPFLRAAAQTTSTEASFDVAAVKPVDRSYHFDGTHFGAHVNAAGASYWNMTPANLIEYAYGVEPFQVAAPEWANHDSFDIEARFPAGADKKDDRKMLQALLKERFGLTFHVEKREVEAHVLVVGQHGEKLTPSLPDRTAPEASAASQPGDGDMGGQAARPKITTHQDGSSSVDLGKQGTQTLKFNTELWAMHYARSKMTMDELAKMLGVCLGKGVHQVLNETGIEGTYNVEWDCPATGPRPPASADPGGTPASDPQDFSSLTRSLDALGLKLEKRKMIEDVYVIDHIEKPAAN